jgi:hypothetical protein
VPGVAKQRVAANTPRMQGHDLTLPPPTRRASAVRRTDTPFPAQTAGTLSRLRSTRIRPVRDTRQVCSTDPSNGAVTGRRNGGASATPSAMVRVNSVGCRRPASSWQRVAHQAFHAVKSVNVNRGVNRQSRTLPTGFST